MASSVASSLPRKLITDHLLTMLRAVEFPEGVEKVPVGDMAEPDIAHGWSTKDPDAAGTQFTPYLSLTPGTARKIEGALSDSSTEYEIPYAVVLCGVSRKQTEGLADYLRRHLHALHRLALPYTPPGSDTPETWKITQIRCETIGGMQRVRGAWPDYFTEQDNYNVRVSKEFR